MADSDDDQALLDAIMEEQHFGQLALRIGQYWADTNRAKRTSRAWAIYQIGMLSAALLRAQRQIDELQAGLRVH